MRFLKNTGSVPLLILLISSIVLFILIVLNRQIADAIFSKPPINTGATKSAAPEQGTWRFIVSGDSRNCGDIVMPAIAAHSTKNYQPAFYWHLGDLRAIYMVDEDMAFADREANGKKLACSDYLKRAWPDFVKNQI